jgi:hypothetical protein
MERAVDDHLVESCAKGLFYAAVFLVQTGISGTNPCQSVESCYALPAIDSESKTVMDSAGRFLGVGPKYVTSFSELEDQWSLQGPVTMMVIADAFFSGLKLNEKEKLIYYLSRLQIHLMILVNSIDSNGSGDFLEGITKQTSFKTEGVIGFSDRHTDILKELTGLKIPVHVEEDNVLFNIDHQKNHGIEPLIWLEYPDGKRHVIMAVKRIGLGLLYIATFPKCKMIHGNVIFQNLPQFLPILIFLKKEGGEYCWHSKAILANLTVDDPWLVEPYGNLSYRALLQQMEKANFHTTIAFVPWNYNRSQREVVELFRRNPEKFSIAFHGNNHDGQEFGDYCDRPLKIQESNVRQAVARMTEFTRLTDIPVSPVMIFPHRIAPEKTLLTLRRYNFIATANSDVIPLGETRLLDAEAMLWPLNLKYYGFPVIQRFHPRADRNIINLALFLQKPILFYTHQDYFTNGIEAFNDAAQYLNLRTSGKAQWANLKQVCDNLYMEKIGNDGVCDIRMMTRSILIKNLKKNFAQYRVVEIWKENKELEKLMIGDNEYSIGFEEELKKPITLRPLESVRIELIYKQPAEETELTIERAGFRIYCIRWLSDLRDRYLSTKRFGRKIIEFMSQALNNTC